MRSDWKPCKSLTIVGFGDQRIEHVDSLVSVREFPWRDDFELGRS